MTRLSLDLQAARLHVGQVALQLAQFARAVEHVDLAVVVEEEGGVVEVRRTRLQSPALGRVGRRIDIAPIGLVVGREVEIELTVVVADGGGPLPASVSGTFQQVVLGAVGQLVEHVADDFPVDQVLGLHHRRTRHEVHGGADHIKVVAHTNHIRIGDIGPHHRVDKHCAVCHLLFRGFCPVSEKGHQKQKRKIQTIKFHHH